MRVLLVLLSICLIAGSCSEGPKAPDNRPNVLVIVVDTLRADRMSAYGYGRETTPVLAGLAQEGVLAADVTAQASWTLPSMVSLFQGRYVTSYRDLFFENAPTMAEAFQEAGYRTLGIVGNGLLSPETGFDRGFDRYQSRRDQTKKKGRRFLAAREAADLLKDSGELLEQLIALDEDGAHVPFFAYVHFMDPHVPYLEHKEWNKVLPLLGGQEVWPMERQRKRYRETHEGVAVDPQAWEQMARALGRYDQELRTSDHHIGLLIDLLKSKGLWDNTILALVADHGEGLWDHESPPEILRPLDPPRKFFMQEHGRVLTKELIGTPMILHGPGIPAGVRIESPVENVDLFPTLVELCGLRAPEGLQGRSLLTAMAGGGTGREHIFSSVLQCRSVRTVPDGYKLILPLKEFPMRAIELYDTKTDPGELHNIADDHPEVVAHLADLIGEWVQRYPAETTLGREKSAQHLADLKALGYASGTDEEDSD